MVLRRRPWLLPVAALAGVLVAAAVATLFGLQRAPVPAPRAASGTVIESASCAQPAARDTVVFVVDGWGYRMPLDACGNQEGAQLEVELVIKDRGEPVVRLAGAGAEPRSAVAERVGAVLLAIAGMSGALLTMWVRPSEVANGAGTPSPTSAGSTR